MLLLSTALAADLHATARARYLDNTGRQDEAERAARAMIEATPGSLAAHVTWIYRKAGNGPVAARATRAIYAAFLAEKPDDPNRRVAFGLAVASERAGGQERDVFPAAGAWCDAVLPWFDPLPPAPDDRAAARYQHVLALRACGRDDTADRAALLAEAASDPAARFPAAWAALVDDTVDEADADAVIALLTVEPWRMSRQLWGSAVSGPGLERARAAVLERARAGAWEDDPMVVAAAVDVLLAAKEREPAAAAITHLRALDPERSWFPTAPTEAPDKEPRPEPTAPPLGDPAATLAALDAEPPGRTRYHRLAWWTRRAEALQALGRDDEALRAWRKAWVTDPGYASNLRFAREAAARGRMLAAAERAADIAVDGYQEASRGWDAPDGDDRAALAEALLVRAQVRLARHDGGAADDAHTALMIEESRLGRALLGLALLEPDPDAAFGQLSRALAGGRTGDARIDGQARAALSRLWPETSWWAPGGLDGWLAAFDAAPAPEPAGEPFPDLTVTLDGQSVLLSSIEGPMIVDVWATWCGPCREGMPVFDAAARRHPEITFLALSVDDELAKVEAYLAGTAPGFRVAWAGKEAWKTMGLEGIPTTFVLDAEHRVVERHVGQSPGSDLLEQAARRLGGR